MTWLSRTSVMLTVRGTAIPETLEERRTVHNQTAGSDGGVDAARALGDLSHKVYLPAPGMSGVDENELLFMDIWKDAEGIGTFFSDEQVQMGASMLFSEREANVWMPAEAAYGFELPAPAHMTGHYVGLARGPVDDPEVAIKAFRAALEPRLSDARRLGQVSHQTFISVPMPGDHGPVEAIGVDIWADLEGMGEFYSTLSGFEGAFSAEPQTSVWAQANGGTWREW